MKIKTLILSCVCCLSLVACGPALTMSGAQVKITPSSSIDANKCNVISAVEVTAGSKEKAEIQLRNKAGKASASHVVVEETVENGGRILLKGQSYNCK